MYACPVEIEHYSQEWQAGFYEGYYELEAQAESVKWTIEFLPLPLSLPRWLKYVEMIANYSRLGSRTLGFFKEVERAGEAVVANIEEIATEIMSAMSNKMPQVVPGTGRTSAEIIQWAVREVLKEDFEVILKEYLTKREYDAYQRCPSIRDLFCGPCHAQGGI